MFQRVALKLTAAATGQTHWDTNKGGGGGSGGLSRCCTEFPAPVPGRSLLTQFQSFSTFVIYYLDKDESTKKDFFWVPSECEAEWFFFFNSPVRDSPRSCFILKIPGTSRFDLLLKQRFQHKLALFQWWRQMSELPSLNRLGNVDA